MFVIFGIFGIIFGSFVNALVWRLHEQAELVGKKGKGVERRRQALSVMKGRSMCPDCGHELAAKDLVPIVSWLWLHGKCRYCGKSISVQYPIVELATGILFAASYLAWPYGFNGVGLVQFACWLVFLIGFMALTVYDLHWFLLPDKLVFPLTVFAIVETLGVAIWQHSFSALWVPAAGAAVIFGLFWGLFQASKGAWIGGGDVKLAITLGLLASTPFRAFVVIFFASIIGTIVSMPQLIRGKDGLTHRIPFGPPLILATCIVVLYGTPIADWYQHLVL